MTRERLLTITKPGDIFSKEANECKIQYHKYAKLYHPDGMNGDAELFEHITTLYQFAQKLIRKGDWQKSNYVELRTINDQDLHLSYLTEFEFELGLCYVCRDCVVYVLKSDKEKYYQNYIAMVKSITYENNEMSRVFQHLVPEIKAQGKLAAGEFYLVIKKSEDTYPLNNMLAYMGEMPGKHAAWIISRLSGLCCFLEYNNIVHNGIDINSCFISPKHHSIALTGGWWYATKKGDPLIGTTKEIFNLMPIIGKTEKRSTNVTDLESVKEIGRKLLAAGTYQKLIIKTDIPKPIIDFLTRGSANDAVEEMQVWDAALNNAYGTRRFVVLDVTENQIYNLKGDY